MVDTSKLNPQIKDILDAIAGGKKHEIETHHDSNKATLKQGRDAYYAFASIHSGPPMRMARVEDLKVLSSDGVHQIPIRIYTPIVNKKLPTLVYYHGGGWQRGDIDTHDSICRHFAHYGEVIVVSVQWRLAPEHKFPIGLNDCLDVYEWVVKNGSQYNIDTTHLGIGGDSAGGNMTAVTTQRLRDRPVQQPIFQLLLYPALDLSCSTWSYTDFAEGFFLTTERVKYYVSHYLNSLDEVPDPLASPIKQSDLSRLPRTHIITAGFDPLRAEGEAYLARLKDAGINVTYTCYEGMIHAFAHMNHTVPAVLDALKEISAVIKAELHKK